YLCYAIARSGRVDFLRVLEEDPPQGMLNQVCSQIHHVWETGIWINASSSRLVRREDGSYRIVHQTKLALGDMVLPNELVPCTVQVHDDGRYSFQLTDGPSNFWIYDRRDPFENEAALREALPALYRSFR